jgi:hypothetical protein
MLSNNCATRNIIITMTGPCYATYKQPADTTMVIVLTCHVPRYITICLALTVCEQPTHACLLHDAHLRVLQLEAHANTWCTLTVVLLNSLHIIKCM